MVTETKSNCYYPETSANVAKMPFSRVMGFLSFILIANTFQPHVSFKFVIWSRRFLYIIYRLFYLFLTKAEVGSNCSFLLNCAVVSLTIYYNSNVLAIFLPACSTELYIIWSKDISVCIKRFAPHISQFYS